MKAINNIMMNRTLAIVFVVIGAIALFSCDDGIDYEKIRQEELAVLQEYIDDVHPGAEPTNSGLYYFNEEGTGEGDTIKLGDRVQIFFAMWTLESDGDSTLAYQTSGFLEGHRFEPHSYIVGATDSYNIATEGVQEASTYMQPGTHSHLVMDSGIAYGQNGDSNLGIGSFQTILMELEVYKVFPLDTGEDDE